MLADWETDAWGMLVNILTVITVFLIWDHRDEPIQCNKHLLPTMCQALWTRGRMNTRVINLVIYFNCFQDMSSTQTIHWLFLSFTFMISTLLEYCTATKTLLGTEILRLNNNLFIPIYNLQLSHSGQLLPLLFPDITLHQADISFACPLSNLPLWDYLGFLLFTAAR